MNTGAKPRTEEMNSSTLLSSSGFARNAQETLCRDINLPPGTRITDAAVKKRQENSVTLPLKVRKLHRYFSNRQTREQKRKVMWEKMALVTRKKK